MIRTKQPSKASGYGSKNEVPKWNLGKWKHGPNPTVCPSCLILSHSHLFFQLNLSCVACGKRQWPWGEFWRNMCPVNMKRKNRCHWTTGICIFFPRDCLKKGAGLCAKPQPRSAQGENTSFANMVWHDAAKITSSQTGNQEAACSM